MIHRSPGLLPLLILLHATAVGASVPPPTFVFVELEVDGAGGVELLDGAVGVAASADGRHVYVAGSVDDSITVFARDAATGALDLASALTPDLDALDSPISVTLSPDGKNLYATGARSHTVAVFARDATSGALSLVERQKDGEGDIAGLSGARDAVVSPNGKHVYVAALIGHAVTIFARDADDGSLVYLDTVLGFTGLTFPVAITMSADGAHVYVASGSDDAIAVFARDAESGALDFVEAESASLDGPSGIAVSPDGRHAYVTSALNDSLVRFDRDAVTGALTFAATISNGVGTPPASGLVGAREIAMTPDGGLVYVIAGSDPDSTVAAFERDAVTGELRFLQVERSGENGFDGFATPLGIALRGRNLYVTGLDSDAIAVLAPEPLVGAMASAALASLVALAGARARR